MKVSPIAFALLLSAFLSGCEGRKKGLQDLGDQRGLRGRQGHKGHKASKEPLAISLFESVSDPCPQLCTLRCAENERVMNAYVVGASKTPIYTNEQTVDFDNRRARGAGPAFIFCVPK